MEYHTMNIQNSGTVSIAMKDESGAIHRCAFMVGEDEALSSLNLPADVSAHIKQEIWNDSVRQNHAQREVARINKENAEKQERLEAKITAQAKEKSNRDALKAEIKAEILVDMNLKA